MEIGSIKDIVTSSATLPSGIYLIILMATGIPIEKVYSDVEGKKHLTFSCKGNPDKYYVDSCLKNYNNGPNELYGLWYHLYFRIPIAVFIIAASIMAWKLKHPSLDGSCKVHLHVVYFVSRAVLIVVHLGIAILLASNLSVLHMETNYNCMIGNSTFDCIDSQVKRKSDMNIACFSCTIFLFVFLVIEFLYNYWKWRKELDRGLPECRKCNQFRAVFYSSMS